MPLTSGLFFAFDAAALKALRGTKGDPARRARLHGLHRAPGDCRLIDLGEAWLWTKWLAGREVFTGKSLHKGSLAHIELLDSERVSGALSKLPQERLALEQSFLAIDEAEFRYRMVPFWVSDEWARDGVTKLLTQERAGRVATAITQLRVFVDEVISAGTNLVLFEDYRS